jgi:hypothetical protein
MPRRGNDATPPGSGSVISRTRQLDEVLCTLPLVMNVFARGSVGWRVSSSIRCLIDGEPS